jgi:hypothetical protein
MSSSDVFTKLLEIIRSYTSCITKSSCKPPYMTNSSKHGDIENVKNRKSVLINTDFFLEK